MKDSQLLIEQSCAGKRPSRTPLFDIFQNDAVIEFYGNGKLDGKRDAEVMIASAGAALDATRHLLPPYPDGMTYTDKAGNQYATARWTSWVTKHAHATDAEWKEWLPSHIEALQARAFPSDAEKAAEIVREKDLNAGLNGSLFIHCTPSAAINDLLFGYRCGLDVFPYLWMDERDLMMRWLKAITSDNLRQIELTAHGETSSLAMIYSDVAYHGKLMFSPDMMKEMLFFDDIAAICDACHRKGLKVIFHSDGYVMEILDALVAAGIDGLNPLEKAAGMDIYDIRRRYPRLILVGGVDVSHLLPFGTTAEVRAETRRLIERTGAEGRLLIGSSTEVGNDVPLDNYRAFHDEVMRG